MTRSTAALLESIADAWRPRPDITLAEWCETHLRLPATTSASPGGYDLRRYSYCRGVLDAAEDPEVERIVLMWIPQLGKTTLLQAILAGTAVLAPGPAMLGTPDKDSLLELRDKFYALCEETEELRDTVPPPRLRNNRWIDVGGCRCQLAYSYNTQRMSGKSCRLVIKTEIDRWRKTKTHGDPSLIIDERVKAFHRSLIVEESTASDENSRIYASYQQSDRRRFLVPCPRCGHYQELRFNPLRKGPFAGRGGVAGLRDEQGELLTSDQVAGSAHYLCEQGCRIESDDKPGMVEQGVHVPKGQTLDKRGRIVGQPLRSRRVWGSRLNCLYSETITFAKAAQKYLECRGKLAAMQVWVNDWLGTRFKQRGKTPKWRSLWARLKTADPPDVAPSWAIFLTAGVDPGPHYCRWAVRAWGEGGVSALVSWGTTRGSPTSRMAHLAALRGELLERHFPLTAPNDAGDKSLQVRLMGVDVGYQSHLVHSWYRTLPAPLGRRVRQLAGKQELPHGTQWRRNVVEVSARTGNRYEGGQERWEISKAIFTEDLHARWKQATNEAGAWLLCDARLGTLELYLRELTNERAARKVTAGGRTVTVWEKIDGNVGNHFADVESMNLALAEMVTGGNWSNLAAQKRRAKAKSRGARRDSAAPTNQQQPYGRMRS